MRRGIRLRHFLVLLPGSLGLVPLGCADPPGVETRTPFDLGKEAAAQEDFGTAVVQLSLAIENSRPYFFTQGYLERGTCFLEIAKHDRDADSRERNLSSALEDFKAVLGAAEVAPEVRARAMSQQGTAFRLKGDMAGAEASFRQIISMPPSPSALEYRLVAHRTLGWILFEAAQAAAGDPGEAGGEVERQEKYRQSQEQFAKGLELDPEDEECNLGKGMCLHFRGQNGEATNFLSKSIARSEGKKNSNPEGHYYLARALELEKGLQQKARDHYRLAVEQDEKRTFTPLYARLVDALLVYVSFEDPEFQWFFDRILDYAGGDKIYWRSVASFTEKLLNSPSEPQQEAGTFARALARARIELIDASVEDALLLQHRPDFLELLSRVFPLDTSHSEYLYGRALALRGAGRFAELESFFEDPVFRSPPPSVAASEDYQRALLFEGLNIVARWLEQHPPSAALQPQDKLERDKTLGRARSAFESFLEKHPRNHQALMGLGEVQELMESFGGAFSSYALIAREVPTLPHAFRRILRLHRERLLPEKDLIEAWAVLGAYTGDDADIRGYIQETQNALQAELLLYCRGCGRKGLEGDTTCLECGRQIGRAPQKSVPPAKQKGP